MSLPRKDPSEIVNVSFDFSNLTASVTSPTVTSTVNSGVTDPSPSSILSGSPTISGAIVTQLITGGVAGTNYKLTCTVTSGIQKFVEAAILPVDYVVPD